MRNDFIYEDLVDDAKNYFGTTTNWKFGFYINPDGTLLDGSGRKLGNSRPTQRAVDHREVIDVMQDDDIRTGDEAMIKYMSEGAIRWMPEAPGITILNTKEPTSAQYRVIKELAMKSLDEYDEFYVDIARATGYRNWMTAENFEYDDSAKPIRIVNDIKNYFHKNEEFIYEGDEFEKSRHYINFEDNKEAIDKYLHTAYEWVDRPYETLSATLIDKDGRFMRQWTSKDYHGDVLKDLLKHNLISLDKNSRYPEYNYVNSSIFGDLGYVRLNSGVYGDYDYVQLPSTLNDMQIDAISQWIDMFYLGKGYTVIDTSCEHPNTNISYQFEVDDQHQADDYIKMLRRFKNSKKLTESFTKLKDSGIIVTDEIKKVVDLCKRGTTSYRIYIEGMYGKQTLYCMVDAINNYTHLDMMRELSELGYTYTDYNDEEFDEFAYDYPFIVFVPKGFNKSSIQYGCELGEDDYNYEKVFDFGELLFREEETQGDKLVEAYGNPILAMKRIRRYEGGSIVEFTKNDKVIKTMTLKDYRDMMYKNPNFIYDIEKTEESSDKVVEDTEDEKKHLSDYYDVCLDTQLKRLNNFLDKLGFEVELITDEDYINEVEDEDCAGMFWGELQDNASVFPISLNKKIILDNSFDSEDILYGIIGTLAHEAGHGIFRYCSDILDLSKLDEEEVVEDFAVDYEDGALADNELMNILRQATTEDLDESFDELDYNSKDFAYNDTIYITDEPNRVISLCRKGDVPYRIFVDGDYYYMISAYSDATHTDMMSYCYDNGYCGTDYTNNWDSVPEQNQYIIFLPKSANANDIGYGSQLGADDYVSERVYNFGTFIVRDIDAYSNSLFRALGKSLLTIETSELNADEWNNINYKGDYVIKSGNKTKTISYDSYTQLLGTLDFPYNYSIKDECYVSEGFDYEDEEEAEDAFYETHKYENHTKYGNLNIWMDVESGIYTNIAYVGDDWLDKNDHIIKDNIRGYVEYEVSYRNKKIYIRMIQIEDKYKRQGIGRTMINDLRIRFPEFEIITSLRTDEGDKFFSKVLDNK